MANNVLKCVLKFDAAKTQCCMMYNTILYSVC
jgi:hypothetical protein